MSNRQTADNVVDAIAASGRHYRDSLPMIASENILSPMVRRACDSDLHGLYAAVSYTHLTLPTIYSV